MHLLWIGISAYYQKYKKSCFDKEKSLVGLAPGVDEILPNFVVQGKRC